MATFNTPRADWAKVTRIALTVDAAASTGKEHVYLDIFEGDVRAERKYLCPLRLDAVDMLGSSMAGMLATLKELRARLAQPTASAVTPEALMAFIAGMTPEQRAALGIAPATPAPSAQKPKATAKPTATAPSASAEDALATLPDWA
jgi:hypothetical protein